MNQKIWIFVIENEVSSERLNELTEECKKFVERWTSHDEPLNAEFELHKNRLLIFKNNEDINPIGGCATDKLFHFIQGLEKRYNVSLLNRQLVVYENNDGIIHVCPLNELGNYIEKGIINKNTIVYNTSVIHSSELDKFAQKFENSWLQELVY